MLRASLLIFSVLAVGCAGSDPVDDEELGAVDSSGIAAQAKLTFAADWSESASGKLYAGDSVQIAYDASRLTQCRGEQGGIPQWSLSGYAQIGQGPVVPFAVAGLNATATLPVVQLTEPGELRVYFQNNNRWGCNAYDSNYGNNYRFQVGLPEDAPGWMGNAASVVSRATCNGGPCDDARQNLDQGFRFDTWARQRATIAAAYFDVWKEGVTDWNNPEVWRELDVAVHYRFDTAAPYATSYVNFKNRVGNDARYELPLRPLDPFGGNTVTDPAACPKAAITLSADGQYVQTEMSFYFTVNGATLRPAQGGDYRGHFEEYRDRFAPCVR